jgi:two-component system, NarL family, sensor histidine kinase UhpB
MPLRFRLIALVVVALLTSLVLGCAATLVNASRSVQNEMRSALLVAEQTVDDVVSQLGQSRNPQHDLAELVASFKGNRHLRVAVSDDGSAEQVNPIYDHRVFGGVPRWFIRLIGVVPETHRVPVTLNGQPLGAVVIETQPRNEILEVWNEQTASLVALVIFAGATIPLIYLFIGRALRPIDRLAAAMEQFGEGDFAIRVDERLAPELARLRDSFNHMATRLDAADADNRRLHEQLLTLQEEERSDIARDLHDEVGPFLFAINVDVANASRLLNEGRAAELPPHIQSVADAARHLQRLVRGMLGRLRPIALTELGLSEAVGRLVEFWRRRRPEVECRVHIAPPCENFGEPTDTVVYRIVQEGLSNALRHGKPSFVDICIGRDGTGNTIVDITDNGPGLVRDGPTPGYGLVGMRERVTAMGGRLVFTNRPQGGLSISAWLPSPAGAAAAPQAETAR